MSDLISRSALLNELIADYAYAAADIVKAAPAVDAVPVVHGRWIITEETFFNNEDRFRLVCSVCGRIVYDVENPKKAIEYRPYCHCGAKMDGGSNDAAD